MDARRVRVRRVTPEEKIVVRKASPKWGPMDIVRIRLEDAMGNSAKADSLATYVPDIFAVLSVVEDPQAVELAKNTAISDPGANHRYSVRSFLSGRTVTLAQSSLDDIDPKFRRFALSFFRGHFAGILSVLNDKLGIVEEDREDDPHMHYYDDDVDAGGESDDEERPAPRRIVEDDEDDTGYCDSDEFDDIDNRPVSRRGRPASWGGR